MSRRRASRAAAVRGALVVAAMLALGVAAARAGQVQVLAHDPPAGGLHPGETVLVDDGTCPAGQIKQVTGGSNVSAQTGAPRPGSQRVILCVPRQPP